MADRIKVADDERAYTYLAMIRRYIGGAADMVSVFVRQTLVQIETPEAASKLEAIASVEGVDAVFLGPADLAANMGHVGNMEEKSVQAKVADVAKRCRALGKPCGIVGPTPEIVERYIGYGYDYVAIASDMGMMMAQARAFMAAVKPSLAKSSSAKKSA